VKGRGRGLTVDEESVYVWSDMSTDERQMWGKKRVDDQRARDVTRKKRSWRIYLKQLGGGIIKRW
jgi:hypothetical protein